ncbi:hypothetical protein [Rhodococcus qingshengii]|uniref:hypothetical protein n=1 Tax=Rhodococcus qingshengii TaxID=334542 RepID=UPI0035E1D606
MDWMALEDAISDGADLSFIEGKLGPRMVGSVYRRGDTGTINHVTGIAVGGEESSGTFRVLDWHMIEVDGDSFLGREHRDAWGPGDVLLPSVSPRVNVGLGQYLAGKKSLTWTRRIGKETYEFNWVQFPDTFFVVVGKQSDHSWQRIMNFSRRN